MGFPHFPFPINHFIILTILFPIVAQVQAQVPANKTFKFINQGEFGDRIIEYDASYRVIRNEVYTFYTFPFRLCFYNTTPNAHIFAIRAGIPNDESLMRWVWDANRNNPVGENATLTFGRDGNFVLADVDGRVAWQTNTANKGVTGIKLLPNGNLVLHDKNGKFIWQSFDYPTDTLLVGQSVRINGRNKLISRTSEIDGSDGIYSIVLSAKGFNMYINNSGKLLIYGGWGAGSDLGSIVTFDAVPENDNATAYELVLAVNQDQAPPPPPPSQRRLLQVRPIRSGGELNLNKLNYNATYSFLRLGYDGNLKAYTYYDKVSYLKWEESFAFFSSYFVRECALPSKCGAYGLCAKRMCVACPSPKGLLGWSENCAPPKLAPCNKSGAYKVDYYKIVDVVHFLSPYLDGGDGPMKVAECREKCNKDCKCLGFFYTGDTSKCLLAPLLGTLIKEVNSTSVGYIKYVAK